MSRRKQAKPRALKRELDEECPELVVSSDRQVIEEGKEIIATPIEGLPEDVDEMADTSAATNESPQQETNENNTQLSTVAMTTVDEEEGYDDYRCEVCSTTFTSLNTFMDHRNFDCGSGLVGECVRYPLLRLSSADHVEKPTTQYDGWRIDGRSPTFSQGSSPSPSSSDAAESPWYREPYSPSTAATPLDQLPYSEGMNETHPYPCPCCHKAFAKLSHLKKHEQVHSDQMPYKCEFCSRHFKHKRSRDRHVKLHTGDRKYRCPNCDAAFARRAHEQAAARIERLQHRYLTNSSPVCTATTSRLPVMSSDYEQSDHLKIHIRTHENDKPYQCALCRRSYNSSAALTSHMLTHKQDSTAKEQQATSDEDSPYLQKFTKYRPEPRSIEFPQMELRVDESVIKPVVAVKTEAVDGDCSSSYVSRILSEPATIPTYAMDVRNKCPFCTANFDDPCDLYRHLKQHDDYFRSSSPLVKPVLDTRTNSSVDTKPHTVDMQTLNKYGCPQCKKRTFSSLMALEAHIRATHCPANDHLFSCRICHLGFSSPGRLAEHTKLEHNNPPAVTVLPTTKFSCEHCPMDFDNAETLKHHRESVHTQRKTTETSTIVCCSQCNQSFSSIYTLADHMHTNHGYNTNSASGIALTGTKNSSKDKPKSTQLTASENPRSQVYNHTKSAPQQTMSSKVSNNNSLTNDETYLCDHCNATFSDFASYQVHVKTIVGQSFSKFSCTECDAEFTSEDQLESHIFVHFLTLTTEYGCTSCLKLFTKPDELQKHLMDIHAHHLYRCSLCKEIFDSKVNIQVHFAIKHSNECKLYKCAHCSSVFRSEMEWQLHVKVNHLGISKPYCCFFCKDSFATETELETHLATHKKPFTCPACDDCFHVEYLLDKHIQSKHAGELDSKDQKSTTDLPLMGYLTPTKVSQRQSPLTPVNNQRNAPASPSPRTKSATPPLGGRKAADVMYKCDICDAKFSDESTLQNHCLHDHRISPEMSRMMKKAQQSVVNPPIVAPVAPSVNQDGSPSGTTSSVSSDKFGQLCVYCNKTFKTKSELEKHMKTHATPANQKCNICDEIFPSMSILAEHKLTHCKVVKGNVCVVCKVAIKNEEQFYQHSQQHGFQGANMQCVVCRQTLSSMLELQIHGRHHFQKSSNNFYNCCVCMKSFDTRENLISKMNSSGTYYYVCKPCYHGENPTEFTCPVCNVKFETPLLLEMHMPQHRKTYQCIKCQESFATEYEIQMHVASHVMQEGNVHECKICRKTYDSPSKLQCHLIEHTFEGAEMKCHVCGSVFAQACTMQMHALEHGLSSRRYSCRECNQKFFFSAELHNHMYCHIPHPAGTDYTNCPECPRSYVSSPTANHHHKMQYDTKADPVIKCSVCFETFRSAAELQEHVLTLHSASEPDCNKTYRCTECSKEFAQLCQLQTHMTSHSNTGVTHTCPLCSKEFSLGKNLTIHLRSHNGQKPYECPVCHKKFARKENRKVHMKCHSGLKPYTCPVCASSFSLRSQLRDHLRTHSQQGSYICDICSDTFNQARQLKQHLVLVHNRPLRQNCRYCSESFTAVRELKLHLQQTHNLQDESLDVVSIASSDLDCSAIDLDDLESDSMSAGSDVINQNGRDQSESDYEKMDTDNESSGLRGNNAVTLDGNVTIVTNPSEQVTVS